MSSDILVKVRDISFDYIFKKKLIMKEVLIFKKCVILSLFTAISTLKIFHKLCV